MSFIPINTTAGAGDSAKDGGDKINAMFSELYRSVGQDTPLSALRLQGMRLISDDAAGLTDAENYLGTQIGFIIAFAETNNAAGTWSDSIAAVRSQTTALAPLNRPIYWAFPLCHGTAGHGWAETMRGDHDAAIKTMFAEIVACNRPLPGNLFLVRLGWEMQFWEAYPWCRAFVSPAQYRALFRKIVMLAREVDPRIKIDWTPNIAVVAKDQKIIDPRPWYPGSDVVDAIGCDAYIRAEIETGPLSNLTPAQTLYNVWEGQWGVNDLYAFAEEKGKVFLIAETGINGDKTSNNSATGDVYSAHINRLYEFVRSKNVLLHGYWNKATPFNCRLSGGQYPLASAAYKAAFDKIAKPWTPALQFGRELIEHRDATDISTITYDSGNLVTSWADKISGKLASASGSTRPVYSATARNNKPGITADGGDDVLIQTDVSNVPVMGKPHTTFVQAFVASGAANFSYLLADTDATGGATNSRAFGHNAGNLRVQGNNVGFTGQPVRAIDSSVIVIWHEAFVANTLATTVQWSVNGRYVSGDNTVVPLTSSAVTKRVLFGNGASSDGVANRIAATLQEQGTIVRVLTPEESYLLSGYLAWKWGTQSLLPAIHPYKNAAPTFGGVLA